MIDLIFLFNSTYRFRDGPIDDLIKFLPKSRDVRLSELRRIYYAPYVLIKFSDIFKCFSCLFFFKGIDIIYAPLIPISLSSSISDYRALFCRRTAARHLTPSIPKEFFLIDPYYIPKLIDFINEFLMNYSRMRDRPT